MAKKKQGVAPLIKELDTIFSIYIRLVNADNLGNVKCYTCGKKGFWKMDNMQCGHFISRSNKKYRFDEENCRVQCITCNVFKSGAYIIYTQKMIAEKGAEWVAEISSLKNHHEIVKRDVEWYKEKIEHFKKEVDILKFHKNIN